MQNKQEKMDNQSRVVAPEAALVVVSIGNHTRLGDVLEYAVAGLAFETIEPEVFLRGSWQNRRVLFAISAEVSGENTQLRALAAGLPGSGASSPTHRVVPDSETSVKVHFPSGVVTTQM